MTKNSDKAYKPINVSASVVSKHQEELLGLFNGQQPFEDTRLYLEGQDLIDRVLVVAARHDANKFELAIRMFQLDQDMLTTRRILSVGRKELLNTSSALALLNIRTPIFNRYVRFVKTMIKTGIDFKTLAGKPMSRLMELAPLIETESKVSGGISPKKFKARIEKLMDIKETNDKEFQNEISKCRTKRASKKSKESGDGSGRVPLKLMLEPETKDILTSMKFHSVDAGEAHDMNSFVDQLVVRYASVSAVGRNGFDKYTSLREAIEAMRTAYMVDVLVFDSQKPEEAMEGVQCIQVFKASDGALYMATDKKSAAKVAKVPPSELTKIECDVAALQDVLFGNSDNLLNYTHHPKSDEPKTSVESQSSNSPKSNKKTGSRKRVRKGRSQLKSSDDNHQQEGA